MARPDFVQTLGLYDGCVDPRLQGTGPLRRQYAPKAHRRDPQRPPRRARPPRHLRRGGPDGRLRLRTCVEGTGPRLSRTGRGIRPDVDRTRLPDRAPTGVRKFRLSRES